MTIESEQISVDSANVKQAQGINTVLHYFLWLLLFVRDNTVTAFFLLLIFLSIMWLLGFNFFFTQQCIYAWFRSVGVGAMRTKRAFLELRRKSFHLAGLLIPFVYYVGLKYYPSIMSQRVGSGVMIFMTTFLWIIELLRYLFPNFRVLYNKIFGSMLRQSELSDNKQLTGTGFFFLGNTICVILFSPTIAVCASLFLVLGDTSAAIVGISFGHIKIGKKSLEGCIAMFCTCFFIGIVLFWNIPLSEYIIFVGSATATLVELLGPKWLDDNLSIPLSSAIAIHCAFIRLGVNPPQP
jgi:diacylglycerol kinase (CTP)